MSSNSQLKYGARLINAYLGDNATISCCEVLNSLIFPAHEQHHNNSFLCAAVVMGQSNMAAGATIGSNHNSRSNDGEIIAKRGFWPGLCVSLKHNSRFASFTIMAKGDYPAELDIPLPFSLVSQNVSKDTLQIMPAYWFMYNMYALARNEWKYENRDRRPDKVQHIEYKYLAPDTANEIIDALKLLELYAGQSVASAEGKVPSSEKTLRKWGSAYLNGKGQEIQVTANGIENSSRKVVILKAREAYAIYKKVLRFYCAKELADYCNRLEIKTFSGFIKKISIPARNVEWLNIGGQLIPATDVKKAIQNITNGKIRNWEGVHEWYKAESADYADKKAMHALAILKAVEGSEPGTMVKENWNALFTDAIAIRKWLSEGVYLSRKKDYSNPFRLMMYDSVEEMEKVLGKLNDNEFILQEKLALKAFLNKMNKIKKQIFQ
jgi:hypothetical protein